MGGQTFLEDLTLPLVQRNLIGAGRSRAKRRTRRKAKSTNLSADTMASMIRKYRWMEIGLTLSLAGLACGRTALDELPAGATGTTALRGIFVPTGDMAVARYFHTATLLPNGRVLVAGGAGLPNDYLASAELYDPGAGRFAATGSMAIGRIGPVATRMNNGKVLVVGGLQSDERFSSAELYSQETGKFTPTASMGADVDWRVPTVTLLPSGMALIADGTDDAANAAVPGRGLYAVLYDPKAGTFVATGSMNKDRVWNTATLLANGQVLMVGGADLGWATAELYDPSSGTFSPTGSMAEARSNHTATLLGNGKVLIAGGGDESNHALASAELFDPATGTFEATGSMTSARLGFTATMLPDGRVLIVGGADGNGNLQTSAEIYQ